MSRTRKAKQVKKTNNKKIKKYIGGLLEESGLPSCDNVAYFPITDADILTFIRTFVTPMDCVINALQLMRVLDEKSANIMRISTLGRTFSKEQIEIIFIYTFRHNFDFKSTDNYDQWASVITNRLPHGSVVFAGYTGHVFLIGRYSDGRYFYIDPQATAGPCDLSDPACKALLRGKTEYYLLSSSSSPITPEQERLVIAYTQHLQSTA